MEILYRCSYQNFDKYSLGLEERRTYSLEAPDIGQLFHEALKTITKWIQNEGKDFASLTKEDSKKYRSEEHTSELQSRGHLVCRLLLEKKKPHMPAEIMRHIAREEVILK